MSSKASKHNRNYGDDDDDDDKVLSSKIEEYSKFIDGVLYPQLQDRVRSRQAVEQDIREYEQLMSTMVTSEKDKAKEEKDNSTDNEDNSDASPPETALVDLGHSAVFCEAKLTNPSRIFIEVGMGIHVEVEYGQQGREVCQKRIEFLRSHVLAQRVREATQVANHLESAMRILEELTKHHITNNSSSKERSRH